MRVRLGGGVGRRGGSGTGMEGRVGERVHVYVRFEVGWALKVNTLLTN